MRFGYFTLSDNHYENNSRNANQFVADIIDEAVYAEEVGLHSAWIGEHHFSTLGVLSCPDLALAVVAARTRQIRLAPAVTVLPLHHPIRVAEQWASLDLLSGGRVDFAAGRGYDRREYLPFGVSFEDNQQIFEEGMEIVRRLWSADGADLAPRPALPFRRRSDHASAGAIADPELCRLIFAAIDRTCGTARMQSDRGTLCRGDDLWRVAPSERPLWRDLRSPRKAAGPPDVQLFYPFRRQSGRRGGGAGAADALLQ